MKIYFLIIVLLLSLDTAFTQTVTIKIIGLKNNKAILSSLQGEIILTIDSTASIKNGELHFSFNKMHSGFYNLTINKNITMNFIYDNENIEIETVANNILDSL